MIHILIVLQIIALHFLCLELFYEDIAFFLKKIPNFLHWFKLDMVLYENNIGFAIKRFLHLDFLERD